MEDERTSKKEKSNSLKIDYDIFRKKYNMPEFEKLSEDFEINKIGEKEGDFLLREIRKSIVEKVASFYSLFESLINPNSPPMFVYSIIKNLNEQTKESIKIIYKKLSKIQVRSIKLDAIYSADEESSYINSVFSEWQSLKKEIYEIVKGFEESLGTFTDSTKRNYFS